MTRKTTSLTREKTLWSRSCASSSRSAGTTTVRTCLPARKARILKATPLFIVLLVVETTDLVFAVDSIPAIFAITQDPFIVYTSNVFAILGLRSLYFLLSHVLESFRYLSTGLAVVLMFIGLKMLVMDFVHIPVTVSLGVVLGIVTVSIVLSLWVRAREIRAA